MILGIFDRENKRMKKNLDEIQHPSNKIGYFVILFLILFFIGLRQCACVRHGFLCICLYAVTRVDR